MKRTAAFLCTVFILIAASLAAVPLQGGLALAAQTEEAAQRPTTESEENQPLEPEEGTVPAQTTVQAPPAGAGRTQSPAAPAAPRVTRRGDVYVDRTGTPASGFVTIDGTLCYLAKGGRTVQSGWICPGGAWYFIDEDSSVHLGWLSNNRKWYYMDDESGRMLTGWIRKKGQLFYLDKNGIMRTGWVKAGETLYYLTESGAAKTGWLFQDGNWYYFNQDCSMQTGWITLEGIRYYLDENGVMQTGTVKIGETEYHFDDDGSLLETEEDAKEEGAA